MTQEVPFEAMEAAVSVFALEAQVAAIRNELNLAFDGYIDVMQTLTGDDLLRATRGFKIIYGDGYASRLKSRGLLGIKELESQIRGTYNDGVGRWRGAWPLSGEDPRPPKGTWVVYQLLLGEELLYIGSSGAFYERAKAHSYQKDFDGWRAAECLSEQHCRELEAALIDRYRPPLNRMIPKPRMVLS